MDMDLLMTFLYCCVFIVHRGLISHLADASFQLVPLIHSLFLRLHELKARTSTPWLIYGIGIAGELMC